MNTNKPSWVDNAAFKQFIDLVDVQGMELISGFMKVAEDQGLKVSPLLIGAENNQVGFSIIVNNEKNHYLNKYQLMLTKRHDSK